MSLTDTEYLLGRHRDNNIQINDLGVSGFHARIFRSGPGTPSDGGTNGEPFAVERLGRVVLAPFLVQRGEVLDCLRGRCVPGAEQTPPLAAQREEFVAYQASFEGGEH